MQHLHAAIVRGTERERAPVNVLGYWSLTMDRWVAAGDGAISTDPVIEARVPLTVRKGT